MSLRTRGLVAASWLAGHLPEGPLVKLADLAGEAQYRMKPDRAARARRNLARVCRALEDAGKGSATTRAAARDPRTLERLVRAAFRHHARYYLEVARTPSLKRDDLERKLVIETPDVVADAFREGRASIFVGLHFGAIELPALFLAARVGGAVAPMETIDDPELQAYFRETRGAAGVRIVGLREARRELLAALREGTSVGIVGDRDLTGGGVLTAFFGEAAHLPLGPAMLAVESGAPLYVMGVRRSGIGRYRGRLEHVPVPAEGSRRERVTGTMTALAGAFERVVATAPEQWWAVFFPIWPDLEGAVAAPTPTPAEPIDPEDAGESADVPPPAAQVAR